LKLFIIAELPFGIIVPFGSPPSGIATAPAPAATLSLPQKAEERFRALSDSKENKRLNELVGFFVHLAAVLLAAALISYSPRDAAFNVSRQSSDGGAVNNWIGPVGAYGGGPAVPSVRLCCVFCCPWLPGCWLAVVSKAVRSVSQAATLVGYGLLLLSLPSLLALCHFPEVRGAIPPGGFAGSLISSSLLAGFNFWGALLVAVALFSTSLFMTTSFSFAGRMHGRPARKGRFGAVERLGILQKAQARWHAWREEREQRRMRRRVEESRLSGRKPVPPQTIGKAENLNEQQRTIRLADGSDIFRSRTETEEEDAKEASDTRAKRRFSCSTAKRKKLPRKKNRRAEDCKGQSELQASFPNAAARG